MSGLTNYSSDHMLDWISGIASMPPVASRFMSLFTGVGTDIGTGFTEVTGSGFARVQVAGAVVTNAATTTASAVIGHSAVPSWVVPGMTAYDLTNGNPIGVVASVAATAVTLTANALHAITSGDSVTYSIFGQGAGTSPSVATSGAAVGFPTSTADWTNGGASPIIAWGLFDALTGGNMVDWDYLGGFSWMPATVSAASPGVITSHAHGISAGGFLIFSTEIAGVAPTFSAGNYSGIMTAGTVTADTISITGVNTSATGDGMIRQVAEQLVPNNVTVTFPAGSFTLGMA